MMDDLLERMIDPAPPQRDAPRRRRLWTTVAILGLAAVGVTSLTTSALFTDRDETTSAIQTGTIDLNSSQLDFVLPAGDLKPLDTVYAPVTVTNDGSLGFQYAISLLAEDTDTTPAPPATGTSTLSDELTLTLYAMLNAGDTCDAAGVGSLDLLQTVSGLPTVSTPLVGTPGTQSGANRKIGAGGSQDLCVQVDVADVGNEFQGTATDVTLQFDAIQLP